MRPLFADIDLAAIRANFDLLTSKAGSSKCIAVVKADAYGHGLVPVAQALVAKASKFAVACLDEALVLRKAGIRTRIMILEGFYSAEELLEGEHAGNLEWVIHDESQLEILQKVIPKVVCKVWLKFNTGMNRLGFFIRQLDSLLFEVAANKALDLQGVVTHFASADEPESDAFKQQLGSVKNLRMLLQAAKVPLSAANSAGLLLHPEVHYDWVRPGISLYGCSPVAAKQGMDFGLQPAMRLVSEIIACRDLIPGKAVGYGATWRASQPTRMGVIAIGYGDGYCRHIASGSPVLVAGQETRIIGRVSMDMITVDITGIDSARIGTEVELWGEGVTADRMARCANTISYHLLTGVTGRVPRRYSGASDAVTDAD